jgi:hypothetical protein
MRAVIIALLEIECESCAQTAQLVCRARSLAWPAPDIAVEVGEQIAAAIRARREPK